MPMENFHVLEVFVSVCRISSTNLFKLKKRGVLQWHCVYSYDAISLGVLSLKKELEWSYIGFWGRDRSVQIQ
jgi:hypothetical protein